MRCLLVAKSVQGSFFLRRYCQRHVVVRMPTPTSQRRTCSSSNVSNAVCPAASKSTQRALTSPWTLPTRSRISQRSHLRKPAQPHPESPGGSTVGSSALISASFFFSFESVVLKQAWMVSVLPFVSAMLYAAGASSGFTLTPRTHSGTLTSVVLLRRMLTASDVAAAPSWLS